MRCFLGPIVQTQLARDLAPDLVEWHTPVNAVDYFQSERAARIQSFAAAGDNAAFPQLQAEIAGMDRTWRAQLRGTRAATLRMLREDPRPEPEPPPEVTLA